MAKAKSRGNGEGSIFKAGKRWRAVLTIGQKADGKLIRKTKTANSRADAAVLLDEMKRTHGLTTMRGVRFAKFLKEWLETVESTRSPATHDLYRHSVDKHIIPYLGAIKLEELKPAHVQRWLRSTQDTAPVARQRAFQILKRALNAAVALEQLASNPTDRFNAPSHQRKPINPFTQEQANRIVEHFEDTHYHLLVLMAFTTGMRQGELLGLQWGDLEDDTVHVRRQMTERSGIQEPKTESAKRAIPLIDEVVEQLHISRRHAFKEGRAKAEDLIFVGPKGGQLKRSNFRARTWKSALETLDLKYRGPHHIRHTFATLSLNSGVPVSIVSRILGHSKPSVTLDVYSHVMSDDIEKAREAVRRMFA